MYPNNSFKLWDIRAPTGYVIALHIDSFEIQQNADYVYVGDGVKHFRSDSDQHGKWIPLTGKKSDVFLHRDFMSNASSIKVIFASDKSDTKSGFIITCSAVSVGHRLLTTTNGRMYLMFSRLFFKERNQ